MRYVLSKAGARDMALWVKDMIAEVTCIERCGTCSGGALSVLSWQHRCEPFMAAANEALQLGVGGAPIGFNF